MHIELWNIQFIPQIQEHNLVKKTISHKENERSFSDCHSLCLYSYSAGQQGGRCLIHRVYAKPLLATIQILPNQQQYIRCTDYLIYGRVFDKYCR